MRQEHHKKMNKLLQSIIGLLINKAAVGDIRRHLICKPLCINDCHRGRVIHSQ